MGLGTRPPPPPPLEEPEEVVRSDPGRRARLFLAAAERLPPELLAEELRLTGLDVLPGPEELARLPEADREVVRRVSLLGESWRNGAPVARAELALLTEGIR